MINTVRVRYFKRFESEEFVLRDDIVVAGPNNAGKSTLLQAIAVWGLALQRWRQERRGKTSQARQRTGVPVSRRDFSAVPLREMNLLWWNRDTAFGRDEEPGRKAGEPKAVEILVEGRDKADQPWSLGVTLRYANRELVYVKLVDSAGNAVTEVPQGAAETQVVHVPPFSGIGAEEPAYDPGYQNMLIGQGKPGDILRNLLREVHEGDKEGWSTLVADVKDVFGIDLLPPKYTPGADPYIVVEYKETGEVFDIASAGSGFHQVLTLLAFFYARPAAILLLDEPDAHQHVVLQRQVFDRLKKVARQHGSQLLVATHSEVLLDDTAAQDLISMYGRPHHLDIESERAQMREALKRVTTLDVLAADRWNVLYVEDESDYKILRELAQILGHPLAEVFAAPFVHPLRGRRPQEAKAHFFALRAIRPDIHGVILLDGDNRAEPEHEMRADGLEVLRWRRYEVESYLLHPAALLRFLEGGVRGPTLWGSGARKVGEDFLQRELPPAVLEDPLGDHPFLDSEAVSKQLLPALFAAAEVEISKKDYYLIASCMRPDEIAAEVAEKMDAMDRVLRRPKPRGPTDEPPMTPPVADV